MSVRFDGYAYLWLDDRNMYMDQFLNYGRQLNSEEMDLVALGDAMAPTITPPPLDLFKQQMDHFEAVYLEINALSNKEIFHSWFQVRPIFIRHYGK